ncbi:MAG: hypothetical protein LAO30_16120 [Acidobacteriia bacterium]|nr:hypothetical protein [Terriglobia bacterium]
MGQDEVQFAPSQRRGVLLDAIRYWELRRIFYNVALTAVVIVWISRTWPHFRDALTLSSLLKLIALALLANACYCAAYLVDIPIQRSSFEGAWWRRWRSSLWVAGTFFAAVLANYWIADEIYPYIR